MTLPSDPWQTWWQRRLCPDAGEGERGESGQLSTAQLRQLSPQALAYVGDAVYELFIRGCYLLPPQRIQSYHRQVVSRVRAEHQAQALAHWLPHLTPEEHTLTKRARNTAPQRQHRTGAAVYGKATAFEALVGYLYLSDPQRLMTLLGHLPWETPRPETEPPET